MSQLERNNARIDELREITLGRYEQSDSDSSSLNSVEVVGQEENEIQADDDAEGSENEGDDGHEAGESENEGNGDTEG